MRFFIVFIFLGLSTVASAQTHFSFLQYMPPTVDPVAAIETNSQFLITNSFDGLVSWDAENGLSPMLAQKWSFSSDRKLVTFYLRKAFFSDGSAFTPVDVVNHFNRLKKSAYFKDHFKNIVETTASSDGAVVFKLKNPSPHFLHLLAGSHSRIVKKIGANIVGIGPFIPTLKKDEALLERNSNYWGEKGKRCDD
ncbi:MAG: hypothetical protein IPK04_16010 [Bdellovibrionales bacterium]|nr:hypothetical protein [Bdellovibrionales bacterium]